MNKKAVTFNLILGIMLAVVWYTAGVVTLPAIKEINDEARFGLNCTSEDISIGTQSACVFMDLFVFIFLGLVLAGVWWVLTDQGKPRTTIR